MTTLHDTSQLSRLMIDHPGWFTTADGQAHRALRSGNAEWVLSCQIVSASFKPTVEVVRQGSDEVDVAPLTNCFDPR